MTIKVNHLCNLGISIIVAFSCQVVKAQTDSEATQAEEFNRIAHSIAARNPLLHSYLLESESEIENLKSENNLPDPEVEGRHLWGPATVGNKWGLSVTQSFDWPGLYVARRRANSYAADAIEALHLTNYYDKLVEIKSALIELIGIRKKVRLSQEILANIDSVNTLISEGFAKGEMTRLDVNKVAIEKINARRSLNEALIAQENIVLRLKTLNGGEMPDLDNLTDYPMITLKSVEEYQQLSQEKNPQMAYLQASIARATAQEKVEKLNRLPSFTLGYELEVEEGNKFNGFSVAVSVPFLSNRHKRKAAELSTKSISLQENVLISDEQERIKSDYLTASRMKEELKEYAPIVENVDNIALLQKAYKGGQINLIEYLTEMSYFSDARQEFLLLQQTYWQTLISLERY